MLEVRGIVKSFGAMEVLRSCSLEVGPHEIVGLIGPNGAGKTTLFNVIAGTLSPDRGELHYNGKLINGYPPHERVRRGLVRTFQIPRLFQRLPVIENLMVAATGQVGESLFRVWTESRAIRIQESDVERRAWDMLRFLNLEDQANLPAASLSGGQKKLLEMGRALMTDPSMILLDEPVAGVNPVLSEQVADHVRNLRDRGKSFLIIGHNMDFIMGISDRVYVLALGEVLAEGTPEAVQANQAVLDAYLGGD